MSDQNSGDMLKKQPPRTKRSWSIAIILIVSLAANIFVAGYYFGGKHGPKNFFKKKYNHEHVAHKVKHKVKHVVPAFNLREVSRHLDEESRRQLRQIVIDDREALRERYKKWQGYHNQLKSVLLSDVVDKNQLIAVLDQYPTIRMDGHQVMKRAMLEVISDQPLKVRQKLVKNMDKKIRRERKEVRKIEQNHKPE